MQFIPNGPDIPDALLQAHEEGRVVFFCGAGISYPAGLPGFKKLVDATYDHLGESKYPIEERAYERERYDTTLHLLEDRIGERHLVRGALSSILTPDLSRPDVFDTHKALVQLSRTRAGALRLVTTNFDRIFEELANRNELPLWNTYSAPMLPIPKARWDGLVYLHGLLPDSNDKSALDRLVLTSGDFGLAYLIERWAARFVSELFRNYVVCFVGYSINDPVLRYMMDALAADRRLGENSPIAYAFGDFKGKNKKTQEDEWRAKCVEPILYKTDNRHALLHQTLKAWASIYVNRALGKEQIVNAHALARPSESTQQDDFIGRMLWALSDDSGIPAKRFAEFEPTPSLEWLDVFSERRFAQKDLVRFRINPHPKSTDKSQFELINRPTPHDKSLWMNLVSDGDFVGGWDFIMTHLAEWLLRYLDDATLLLWFANRGGQLHPFMKNMIERRLNRITELEKNDINGELAQLKVNSPKAIPSKEMRVFWNIVLANRLKSHGRELGLYSWADQLKQNGLTIIARINLRKILAPVIKFTRAMHWDLEDFPELTEEAPRRLISSRLSLATDHVDAFFKAHGQEAHIKAVMPLLFDDLQSLLRDAQDMMCELGEVNEREDLSYLHLPSISHHWQNQDFHKWTTLVILLRDSWLDVYSINIEKASFYAYHWNEIRYPIFKRLALFAASKDKCIPSNKWVDWLLEDDAWPLWTHYTQRETLRLLVLQGGTLTNEGRRRIEAAILNGPRRDWFRASMTPDEWGNLEKHSIWLRLAKLQSSGVPLGPEAAGRLKEISAEHTWKLADNERDEFPSWSSGTGDPDYNEGRVIDYAPHKRRELVIWLKKPRNGDRWNYEDTWGIVCRKHMMNCGFALCDLSQEGLWLPERWREALQIWGDSKLIQKSWKTFAPLVQKMPEEVIYEIAHTVSYWLKSASHSLDTHEEVFHYLCRKLLCFSDKNQGATDRPVSRALNHPVGHVTESLLNRWFTRDKPNNGDLIPNEFKRFFTRICDTQEDNLRSGRVILASRLVTLFHVDREWTESHLLPLFDWKNYPNEAGAVWAGFLWSPRFYPALQLAFKKQFLDTAKHWKDLGEDAPQYPSLLTYVALSPVATYSPKEFRDALSVLPEEGLRESARSLVQALKGAGPQKEEYWRNRILPFWKFIWPKSKQLVSQEISDALAQLPILAGQEFPSALNAVKIWLKPVRFSDYVLGLLIEAKLHEQFPSDALNFLSVIIDETVWIPRELKQCLETITGKDAALRDTQSFKKLWELTIR